MNMTSNNYSTTLLSPNPPQQYHQHHQHQHHQHQPQQQHYQQSNPPQFTNSRQSNSSTPTTVSTSSATNNDGENSTLGPYKLSEDRASSIGWYFIKSYYDFFVTKLDEIYKIYHPKASVFHDLFPESNNEADDDKSDNIPSVFKANGAEAIKTCFQKYNESSSVTNRIVITSACFQVSMGENIIIVTFGEWSRNNSPFKPFSQTFVLVPGKKENTYDVSNDILRFIESNGFKENVEENQSVIDVSKVQNDKQSNESISQNKATNEAQKLNSKQENSDLESKIDSKVVENQDSVQSKNESDVEEKRNEEKESPSTNVDIDKLENEDEDKAEIPDNSSSEDIDVETETSKEETPKEEDSKEEQSKEETSKDQASKPSTPMTWADLAYQAVPVSNSKSSNKTTPTSAQSSTIKSTNVNKKSSASASATPTNTSNNVNNGKFRKEDWFPIYIRGIRQLDEKVLKQHLSKNFGDLKFFKVNQNIALCDFVDQEAQKKALSVKETTLDGVTFNLEPRESKTGNNYHNSHGKKFNKDKDNNSKDINSKDRFEKVENRKNSANNNFNGKKLQTSSKKLQNKVINNQNSNRI